MLHDGCTSGSIHQTSQVFDGPGRGLQCVANAVCAILHGLKIYPASWKSSDIDEILHKGYILYQYVGKLGRLLPSDILGYISVDEMNYGLVELQSYIGSFTSGQKDFNIMTINMLRDVFNEFGEFLLCIRESASAISTPSVCGDPLRGPRNKFHRPQTCGYLAYVNIATLEWNKDDKPRWNLYYMWQVITKF